jgi:hypothetical protein
MLNDSLLLNGSFPLVLRRRMSVWIVHSVPEREHPKNHHHCLAPFTYAYSQSQCTRRRRHSNSAHAACIVTQVTCTSRSCIHPLVHSQQFSAANDPLSYCPHSYSPGLLALLLRAAYDVTHLFLESELVVAPHHLRAHMLQVSQKRACITPKHGSGRIKLPPPYNTNIRGAQTQQHVDAAGDTHRRVDVCGRFVVGV